jgi:hypothetical protein
MKLISITKSDKAGKKLKAVFEDPTSGRRRTTHFGAKQNGKPMDDYITTHDKEQRTRYRTRHKKDLETGDPTRAGFLSYYVLWGDSTDLQTNIASFKRRFHL